MWVGPHAEQFWLAIATTLAAVGAVWQCIVAMIAGLDSLRTFIGAHNQILRDETERALSTVPKWRLIARRRALQQVNRDASDVLTQDEQRLNRNYDRQANAWGCVVAGALLAATLTWVSFFSGL